MSPRRHIIYKHGRLNNAQVFRGECRLEGLSAGRGRKRKDKGAREVRDERGRSEKSVLGLVREIERRKKEIEGMEGRRGEMKGKRAREKSGDEIEERMEQEKGLTD